MKEKEDIKLKPYDRLQSILSEKNSGKLTDNALEKLDFLLETKPSLFTSVKDKVFGIFSKIDSFLFAKRGKISNNFQARSKKKDRWT